MSRPATFASLPARSAGVPPAIVPIGRDGSLSEAEATSRRPSSPKLQAQRAVLPAILRNPKNATIRGTDPSASALLPSPAQSASAIRPQSSVLGRFAAFTLIELLVVITIIGILAALVLAAMGGVQKRGARDKAQSEIQALSAAIEEYFIDYRVFPRTNAGFLYAELTSDTAAGVVPFNTTKVYFEPSPDMVRKDGMLKTFIDPWDAAYEYTTNASGYFEILSKAGTTNTNQWIRN